MVCLITFTSLDLEVTTGRISVVDVDSLDFLVAEFNAHTFSSISLKQNQKSNSYLYAIIMTYPKVIALQVNVVEKYNAIQELYHLYSTAPFLKLLCVPSNHSIISILVKLIQLFT